MPHVTVIFDPKCVSQEVVTRLKRWLWVDVAKVMSSRNSRLNPNSTEDITTTPQEIVVKQLVAHPTDMNMPAIEIYIEAGRPKGRSGDKIAEMLAQGIISANVMPEEVLMDEQSGIFVTFHERNGFRFIKRNPA